MRVRISFFKQNLNKSVRELELLELYCFLQNLIVCLELFDDKLTNRVKQNSPRHLQNARALEMHFHKDVSKR